MKYTFVSDEWWEDFKKWQWIHWKVEKNSHTLATYNKQLDLWDIKGKIDHKFVWDIDVYEGEPVEFLFEFRRGVLYVKKVFNI